MPVFSGLGLYKAMIPKQKLSRIFVKGNEYSCKLGTAVKNFLPGLSTRVYSNH